MTEGYRIHAGFDYRRQSCSFPISYRPILLDPNPPRDGTDLFASRSFAQKTGCKRIPEPMIFSILPTPSTEKTRGKSRRSLGLADIAFLLALLSCHATAQTNDILPSSAGLKN